MLLERQIKTRVIKLLDHFPVVGIIGPRQVGKTTLVKSLIPFFKKESIYLDLELDSDFSKLQEPEFFLNQFTQHTVIIDEVQRYKNLFPLIRALIDQNRIPARFILLGSASPELIRDSSESLAGRIAYVELNPFGINEMPSNLNYKDLWLKGGFPISLLSGDKDFRMVWFSSFIKTYLERDLPLLGLKTQPLQIERLWKIIASLNGNLLNYSDISKSLGVASNTVKTYIDFLENAFLIRRIYPYSTNLQKRIVKSPKIFIRDTGILHHIYKIYDISEVLGNIIAGNSWEGFIIQQIIQELQDCYEFNFYRTHQGSEIDLVLIKGLIPEVSLEIKLTSNPVISKGNMLAIKDLNTKSNFIITPESDDYMLNREFRVCNITRFMNFYIPLLLKNK